MRASRTERPRRSGSRSRSSFAENTNNEVDNEDSAEISDFTYCRRELSAWPIRLVPPHAYDPARLILSYFWMSNKVRLDLKKYICRHSWIRRDRCRDYAYVYRVQYHRSRR